MATFPEFIVQSVAQLLDYSELPSLECTCTTCHRVVTSSSVWSEHMQLELEGFDFGSDVGLSVGEAKAVLFSLVEATTVEDIGFGSSVEALNVSTVVRKLSLRRSRELDLDLDREDIFVSRFYFREHEKSMTAEMVFPMTSLLDEDDEDSAPDIQVNMTWRSGAMRIDAAISHVGCFKGKFFMDLEVVSPHLRLFDRGLEIASDGHVSRRAALSTFTDAKAVKKALTDGLLFVVYLRGGPLAPVSLEDQIARARVINALHMEAC